MAEPSTRLMAHNRHHPLRQVVRFIITGVVTTGVHVLTAFSFLALVSPSQVYANGVAFAVANTFSYIVNSLWSFSKPLHGKRWLRYIAVSGIGFSGTIGIAYLAEQLGLSPQLGILMVVCVMTPISFVLHRSWTFRD